MRQPHVIRVDPRDHVVVTSGPLRAGAALPSPAGPVAVRDDVPAGHKIAVCRVEVGQVVLKYGRPIGRATNPIEVGDWVHTHNLATVLEEPSEYRYVPAELDMAISSEDAVQSGELIFSGIRRANGTVGTRNEIWIVPTVGCVNRSAERIARVAEDRFRGKVDGIHAFSHPYGCSQLGDDLGHTRRVLAGLIRHPNVGGALVLGLGCENNQVEALLEAAGDVDPDRVAFFDAQDVPDEVDEGLSAVLRLVERAENDRREPCPISELVVGMKCGGSDGFSGISANPVVGRIADRVTGLGGRVILTEVPEMFGAERLLMNRAVDEEVFVRIVELIDRFKRYFRDHGQAIYENPSPGNLEGGLTTLEEKSLGAVQKGGRARVSDVLAYGDPVRRPGLSLLEAPGNDGVSSTAMVVSGATVLLFTTGRGTPLGFPVPTVKISSNAEIAEKKPHWIDFNAGTVLDGDATLAEATDTLLDLVLDVASGRKLANNEKHDYREIAIWKDGVTL